MVSADCDVTNSALFVTSFASAIHPLVAAGSVITPLDAVPPVPITILNADVLLAVMAGVVPKPLDIVGAVFDNKVSLLPASLISPPTKALP